MLAHVPCCVPHRDYTRNEPHVRAPNPNTPVATKVGFEHLNLGIVANTMELEVEPILEQEIRKGQLEDEKIKDIAKRIVISKALGFPMDDQEQCGLVKGFVCQK